MTDNADLISDLQCLGFDLRWPTFLRVKMLAAADALAARDAACGHLPNELVAKWLEQARRDRAGDDGHPWLWFTDDEIDALNAATFEVIP